MKLESLSPSMCRGLFSIFIFVEGASCPRVDAGRWPTNEMKTLKMTESGIIDKLCKTHEDLRRRRSYLPAVLRLLGVERVVAEANRKPVLPLVSALGRTIGNGKLRIHAVRNVCHETRGMEEDGLVGQQRFEGGQSLIGTPRPEDHVRVIAAGHHNLARESRDEVMELRKRNVLSAGDELEDCGFHVGSENSLENV